MRRIVGRLLCRLGWHKHIQIYHGWAYACARPDCAVNRQNRRQPGFDEAVRSMRDALRRDR
jgi:hypothetical protein